MFKWKTYIFILSGIFPLLFADIAFAQTLTLYTYPPAHPYRWENPHRLLVSTLNNYYFGTRRKDGRLIGHMIIVHAAISAFATCSNQSAKAG